MKNYVNLAPVCTQTRVRVINSRSHLPKHQPLSSFSQLVVSYMGTGMRRYRSMVSPDDRAWGHNRQAWGHNRTDTCTIASRDWQSVVPFLLFRTVQEANTTTKGYYKQGLIVCCSHETSR